MDQPSDGRVSRDIRVDILVAEGTRRNRRHDIADVVTPTAYVSLVSGPTVLDRGDIGVRHGEQNRYFGSVPANTPRLLALPAYRMAGSPGPSPNSNESNTAPLRKVRRPVAGRRTAC